MTVESSHSFFRFIRGFTGPGATYSPASSTSSASTPRLSRISPTRDLLELPEAFAEPLTDVEVAALRRSAWRNAAASALCVAGVVVMATLGFAGLGIPFLATGLPMAALGCAAIFFGVRANERFEQASQAAPYATKSAEGPGYAPLSAGLAGLTTLRPDKQPSGVGAHSSSSAPQTLDDDHLSRMAAEIDALDGVSLEEFGSTPTTPPKPKNHETLCDWLRDPRLCIEMIQNDVREDFGLDIPLERLQALRLIKSVAGRLVQAEKLLAEFTENS